MATSLPHGPGVDPPGADWTGPRSAPTVRRGRGGDVIADHSRQSKDPARAGAAGLGLLVAAALLLRLLAWPAPGEMRDWDEAGYAMGGPLLLEGMPPGYRFAPGGITHWTGWLHAGLCLAAELRGPADDEPQLMRPYAAADRALAGLAADLHGLRLRLLAVTVLLAGASVAAAWRLGRVQAGPVGAWLAGGLAAGLPLFVEHATMTRPYANAWALGLCAAAAATSRSDGRRLLGGSLLLGLAIACRVDMLLLVPLVLGFAVDRGTRPSARTLGVAAMLTAAAAHVAAPWFLTGLLGNLRTILLVRVLGASTRGTVLPDLCLEQGLAPALVLAALGVALQGGARRRVLACTWAALLLASGLASTDFGLRHQGALVVCLVAAAPAGLEVLQSRAGRRAALTATLLALLPPALLGIRTSLQLHRSRLPADPAAWLEAHAPAGAPVFIGHLEERPPLPTAAAADRLWAECSGPGAWREKVRRQLRRRGLPPTEPPRALSDTHLVQERGLRRRFFLLGSESAGARPRYDLRLYSDAAAFDTRRDEVAAEARRRDGWVVWRGPPPPELGPALVRWTSAGRSVSVHAPGRAPR